MVTKDEDKYVVWPIYFDKNVSREDGRKIHIQLAVENPDVERIAKAAQSLGLNPVLEKDAAYPSERWHKKGRILIDKKDKKSKLLKMIAKRL